MSYEVDQNYDVLLCKTQHHLEVYQNLLVEAVGVMEEAAKTTTDGDTFKKLTVGFNKLREGVQSLQ